MEAPHLNGTPPEDLVIRYFRDTGRIEIHGQPMHIAIGMLHLATAFYNALLAAQRLEAIPAPAPGASALVS